MEVSLADNLPRVLVDAGNALFNRHQVRPDNQAKLANAEAILAIYRLLDYDAIAVGPMDLSAGADLLRRPEFGELPLISANLYNRDGVRLFPSHRSLRRAGLKIACVGVTAPLTAVHHESLKVTEPAEELSRLLPELTQSHDLIVLLSSLPHQELLSLVARFSAIDLSVGADFRKNRLEPRLVGQTLVVQGERQGKYLDYLTIDWRGSPWENPGANKLLKLQQRLQAVEAQLRQFQPRQQESQTSVARRKAIFLKNKEDIKRELARLQEHPETEASPGSTFNASAMPLHGSLPEDPRVLEIINNYKEQQRRTPE